MKTKKIAITGILVLSILVLAGSAFFLTRKSTAPASGTLKVQSGEVRITMTEDAYEPSELLITKGTTVHFVNADTYGHWPASDLHPTHSILPEFDPKRVVKAGETWSYRFDTVGEWGMHDHLSPYIIGKITVVEKP